MRYWVRCASMWHWHCFASNKNAPALVLLSQKCMGKCDFVQTSQEAAADGILFASSLQPVPLRHHFPFLEMRLLFHLINIFFLCWRSPPTFEKLASLQTPLPTQRNIRCLFHIKTTCKTYLSLHNLHHCNAVQNDCRALLGLVCSH